VLSTDVLYLYVILLWDGKQIKSQINVKSTSILSLLYLYVTKLRDGKQIKSQINVKSTSILSLLHLYVITLRDGKQIKSQINVKSTSILSLLYLYVTKLRDGKQIKSQINVRSTSILSRIVVQIKIHLTLHFFANEKMKDTNTTHQFITQHFIYIEKKYILSGHKHKHKQLLDLSSWRA